MRPAGRQLDNPVLKARKSIEDKYPHIVSLNCVAHSLHLIISDLLKCQSVSTLITEVVDLVMTIKKSQILNAHFDSIRINF